MKSSGICALAVLAVSLSIGLLPAPCVAAEPGVVFQPTPSLNPSAYPDTFAVEEPASGQYVYSARPAAPRSQARFAIGKAPRSDFTVYSAEEQQELLALRNRLSTATSPQGDIPNATAKRTRRARRHQATRVCAPASGQSEVGPVEWPKVIRDGAKVCVPKPEFADKADWREHVWCFNKGDGSVR